jgi:hypothetical protein
MMVRRANAIRAAKPALQEDLLAMSTPKFSTHPRFLARQATEMSRYPVP